MTIICSSICERIGPAGGELVQTLLFDSLHQSQFHGPSIMP